MRAEGLVPGVKRRGGEVDQGVVGNVLGCTQAAVHGTTGFDLGTWC